MSHSEYPILFNSLCSQACKYDGKDRLNHSFLYSCPLHPLARATHSAQRMEFSVHRGIIRQRPEKDRRESGREKKNFPSTHTRALLIDYIYSGGGNIAPCPLG